MAQLWQFDVRSGWTTRELVGANYCLTTGGLVKTKAACDVADAESLAWLHRVSNEQGETWALLAAPGREIQVNGDWVDLGLVALRDKDCIQIAVWDAASRRLYFSTERLASIESYQGATKAACPRCKQTIEPNEKSVRCPLCGVWHHEASNRNCWTYAPRCAACQIQPTPLDAGFRWTPEDL